MIRPFLLVIAALVFGNGAHAQDQAQPEAAASSF
jgi:hypothetical protein